MIHPRNRIPNAKYTKGCRPRSMCLKDEHIKLSIARQRAFRESAELHLLDLTRAGPSALLEKFDSASCSIRPNAVMTRAAPVKLDWDQLKSSAPPRQILLAVSLDRAV
eukprot:1176045-Prorocentrum_minimum.AAC.4